MNNAGDGGHDCYAYLLQGRLDRRSEAGKLRSHGRKATLKIPNGAEQVVHQAAHSRGQEADDTIP